MCGIFAIFLKRPLTGEDIALGQRGTAALRHRGPDGEGKFVDIENGVFLGHRRLAIIDLSRDSDQPMAVDGCQISYNGEIYNYVDLRNELEQTGVSFTTRGDVEVLLRAWQTWGEDALQKLDGMFAFAIWDGHQAQLATDAFGEKPLYYAETRDGVYVASEIGPLVRLLSLRPELAGDGLAAFLSLGYVPPPMTAYPQVKRLPAATTLTIRNGTITGLRRYWKPLLGRVAKASPRPLTERDLDKLHETLVESIKRRLVADVPLCLFLSSGVDSSLIAAIAARELGIRLKCVTVAFSNNQSSNEAPQAAAIARHLGLEHETIQSVEDPERAGPDAVIELFGQPCDSLAALSILGMSTAVQPDYKVALTGMGGDEIFLGYYKYAHFYKWRRWYGTPEWFRLRLGWAARLLASTSSGRLNAISRHLAFSVGVRDWERYIAQKNFPVIDWLRDVESFKSFCQVGFAGDSTPLEYQVAEIETAQIMPGSRLVATDVSSMRVGLELRTPYLSRRLSETVAQFDPRCFMAFGQKSVLRRILSRYLPEEFTTLPKRGFVFPQDQFLSNFGKSVPRVPGLSDAALEYAWHRRTEESGWRRLAVRLALADTFARGDQAAITGE